MSTPDTFAANPPNQTLSDIFYRLQSWQYPVPPETWTPLAADVPDDFPHDLSDEELAKSLPQVFKSPGGKKWSAARIVKAMPPHKRYVEAFSGSAAVFWRKDPSPEEVVNDMRQNLIDVFRYLRDESDYSALYQKDWKPSKETFMKLREWKPQEPVDKAYRYLWLARASLMNTDSNSGYSQVIAQRNIHPPMIQRMQKWHARLQGVSLLQKDAMAVIDHYDDPYTFYYLDPPYPKGVLPNMYPGHEYTMADIDKLMLRCSELKGKVLMSLNPKSLPKGGLPENLIVKRVAIWYPALPTSHTEKTVGRDGQTRMEVWVTNYKLGG